MKRGEKWVCSCAVEWWKMRRPISYTQEMHCDNPAVNQTGERDAMLARAVAAYVKKGIKCQAMR